MFGQRLEISDVLVEWCGRVVGREHLSGLGFDLYRTKAFPSKVFQCIGNTPDTGEQFSEGEFLHNFNCYELVGILFVRERKHVVRKGHNPNPT